MFLKNENNSSFGNVIYYILWYSFTPHALHKTFFLLVLFCVYRIQKGREKGAG
jgi:hypothetical protein